jgi:hypothetical protein
MKSRRQAFFGPEIGVEMFLRKIGTLHRTKFYYIPEDRTSQSLRRENHTCNVKTLVTCDTPKTLYRTLQPSTRLHPTEKGTSVSVPVGFDIRTPLPEI